MDVINFIKDDYRRNLFPLTSSVRLIESGRAALDKFIRDNVLDREKATTSFLACPTVFALKDHIHLRRTFVLDPFALLYLYSFVLRNRVYFQAPGPGLRRMYGYSFSKGVPVDSFADYHRFRRRKYKLKDEYNYFAKVDISNCFNCFYHHDIVEAMESRIGLKESQEFGQFLREINAGTSVNCFPQGLYPAKAIGNWFLSFIETSGHLKSPAIIRYIDDIYLFANHSHTVREDVLRLQHILANYSLTLNPDKTRLGSRRDDFEEREIDEVKIRLLKKRERKALYDDINEAFDDELSEDDEEDDISLDDEEREYLKSLIGSREADEEDVELALSLLRDDVEAQMMLAEIVIDNFPHLMKSLHGMIGTIPGHGPELWDMITSKLRQTVLTGYELFWIVRIIADYYELNGNTIGSMLRAHQHPASDMVVKAAVLESPEMSHGLEDLKVDRLRNEPGNLAGMAAAVGLGAMGKGKRNQLYKYAARSGPHMAVVCNILSTL